MSHSEANATPEQIQKFLPDNAGRYHIYRFKHDFNNETLNSLCKLWQRSSIQHYTISFLNLVFLYSVPGHGTKIKQRMVYASCKESVIDAIEKTISITFDRKVNIL